MPLNNRSNNRSSSYSSRSGGSNRTSRSASSGGKRSKVSEDYNMMSFGVGFFDEDGKYPKVRILLKKEDAKVGIVDERNNEYSREEAAALIAEALLAGRGISLYLFENDDGSMSGNARIDVNNLDVGEPEPAPAAKRKPAPASAPAGKRKVAPAVREYPPIVDADLDEEDADFVDDNDDNEPPY